MAEETNGGNGQQGESEGSGGGGGKGETGKADGGSQSTTRDRVLTATALSLAAGTSFFAARKALSSKEHEQGGGEDEDDEQQANGSQPAEQREAARTKPKAKAKPKGDAGLMATLDSVSWDRVGEMLLPLAEKAATTAGEYVANEGPEILTDRLLPRFIDSFNGTRARKSS